MTTEASEQTITISIARYEDLESSERELICLQNAGVDNWSGYSEAMKEFYGEDEDED